MPVGEEDSADEALVALTERLKDIPEASELQLKIKDIPLLIKYLREAGKEKGFNL